MLSALEIAAGPVVASSGDRRELVSWAFVLMRSRRVLRYIKLLGLLGERTSRGREA